MKSPVETAGHHLPRGALRPLEDMEAQITRDARLEITLPPQQHLNHSDWEEGAPWHFGAQEPPSLAL